MVAGDGFNLMNPLCYFLEDKRFDVHGRYISDICKWDNERLEYVHDYIQWVFPLYEPSKFAPHAPVLDHETVSYLKHSQYAMENMETMLNRMENFYTLYIGNMTPWWVNPGNHNYLRLTRILKCLMIFEFDRRAKDLFTELEMLYMRNPTLIGGETYHFWKKALQEQP